MKEDLHNANDKIKTLEDRLKDNMKNTMKYIQENIWRRIMQSSEKLCEWFQLTESMRQFFIKIKGHYEKSTYVYSKEEMAKKILKVVYSSRDSYLASKGIKSPIDAIVKTSSIIQKCLKLRETSEVMDSCGKKIVKLQEMKNNLIKLGLPKPVDTSNKFIGEEAYKKIMEIKMKSDIDLLPKNTTPKSFLEFIQPFTTLNTVLDETVMSSKSYKCGMLTKLELTFHSLQNIDLPSNEEWSTLQKLAQNS